MMRSRWLPTVSILLLSAGLAVAEVSPQARTEAPTPGAHRDLARVLGLAKTPGDKPLARLFASDCWTCSAECDSSNQDCLNGCGDDSACQIDCYNGYNRCINWCNLIDC